MCRSKYQENSSEIGRVKMFRFFPHYSKLKIDIWLLSIARGKNFSVLNSNIEEINQLFLKIIQGDSIFKYKRR